MATTILTDRGLALVTLAAGSSSSVVITSIAVGDGGGAEYAGAFDQSALVGEQARVAIERRSLLADNVWRVVAELPAETPAFDVRELGFLDANGELIALCTFPSDQVRTAGSLAYIFEHVLDFSRVSDGVIIVDAPDDELLDHSVVVATALANLERRQSEQTDELAVHAQADDPHAQYLTIERAAARYEPKGEAARHAEADDPHSNYLNQVRGDARYFTQAQVNDLIAAARNPTGEIIAFAGDTAPDGFLKCNGVAVSRTDYAALYAVIGDTYGAGDGATTFELPDLRGEFLRGLDDGRGVDAGRVIGSHQDDAVQDHDHLQGGSTKHELYGGAALANTRYTGADPAASIPFTSALSDEAGQVNARHADETRPRNVAVNFCIKL